MSQTKLLIATTNKGKLKELQHFLMDLPFEIISLNDLNDIPAEPEETEATIEGNAILKAKYYGEYSGLLTLADDGGLFVDALNGYPGVTSARIGQTGEIRCNIILEKLKGLPEKNRTAFFQLALALYDPNTKDIFIAHGHCDGKIMTQASTPHEQTFGYNPIFYVPEAGKTYAEMNLVEKNQWSHRGKALMRMKYHLIKNFTPSQVVSTANFLIKNGQIILAKRNDPHNPGYHDRWEFPGGIVEYGESFVANGIREVKEETGYDVEVVKQLNYVHIHRREGPSFQVQIYLIPQVCKIIGGDGKFSDAEILELKTFDLDNAPLENMIGNNDVLYKKVLPELKEIIKDYGL